MPMLLMPAASMTRVEQLPSNVACKLGPIILDGRHASTCHLASIVDTLVTI